MQKLLPCPPRHLWQQIDSFVRSATKGFKETKIFNFTEEGTICHGS